VFHVSLSQGDSSYMVDCGDQYRSSLGAETRFIISRCKNPEKRNQGRPLRRPSQTLSQSLVLRIAAPQHLGRYLPGLMIPFEFQVGSS
jgi:hypothetical protein